MKYMNSEHTEEHNHIEWSPSVYPYLLLLTAYCCYINGNIAQTLGWGHLPILTVSRSLI